MAQKNPLLDLSTSITEIARDFILIDETKCYIRSKQEFSIKDYVTLRIKGKRLALLYNAEETNDESLLEFTETMDWLMNFIFVDISKETLDKLTDLQQMEIMQAFTKLLKAEMPEGEIEETLTEAQKIRKLALKKKTKKNS